jgi:Zn/Cd-binding protein ZinT
VITNPLLKASIKNVLSHITPTQVSLRLDITTRSDTNFTYSTYFLENFMFTQDYYQNYMDDITTSIKISPAEYTKLYDNRHNLSATLTVSYISTSGQHILASPEPLVYQYRMLLLNLQNLKLKYADIDKYIEPSLTIPIRLIEPEMYDITQQEIYGIFRNTTITGVIKHIAQMSGITNLSIYPADNVLVYDHIIIPPTPGKNFSNIFSWLQDNYGVYFKGLAAYFTGRTLYIYPPYESRPRSTRHLHVYVGEKAEQAGLTSYHWSEEDITHLVSFETTKIVDLSQGGGEEYGTGIIMTRSSEILDGAMETTEYGSKFTQQVSAVVNYNDAKLVSQGKRNTKHANEATDNIFALTSRTVKYQAQLINFNWSRSTLNLLYPGHKTKYLYDSSGIIGVKEGRLEGVQYSFDRVAPIGDNGRFGYVAYSTLRLRVETDDAS